MANSWRSSYLHKEMSKKDLIKSYIKRRILLPVTRGLQLEKNKSFKSFFNYLLEIFQVSDSTAERLRDDFFCIDNSTQDPIIPGERKKKRYEIPPDADSISYPPVRLIAFYLPQFHAIPENNAWWGEGFTEWTNVKVGMPQFAGHYQPHEPAELGYYNLDNIEVMKSQAEMAKLYGIEGFCFYFYWFAGKRLLEKPILQYLECSEIKHSFCLCWANENWSRRWDGLDREILIAQDHSPEDDIAFIKYIHKYLTDSRYIKINGKPLLLVYRPSLLPTPKETVQRWRKWCSENGIGEIYIAYTQSFEAVDPDLYGFDAAIEFPPNNSAPPIITENVPDRCCEFTGLIYDWSVFPERSINYTIPRYKLYRGVCPSWDNTARRKNNGTIFLNSSPAGYLKWLTNAIVDTVSRFKRKDDRLIFVNAWNEWAEGAYLEPNKKYGHAYLEATRKALEDTTRKLLGQRIVLVSHDAHPHGAQYLVLNMAKIFSESMGFNVDLLVLGDGELIEEYKKYANVHELAGADLNSNEVNDIVSKLYQRGAQSAIVNTTVSGLILPSLKKCGFKVISLVHELPQLIKDYKLQEHVKIISEYADKVVFAAAPVLAGFESFTKLDKNKSVIRPQGLYKKNALQSPIEINEARIELRKRFNLPKDAKIILGVGFADYRKGIDIFIESGIKILEKDVKAYFLWLGKVESKIENEIRESINQSGFKDYFLFPGLDYNTDIYYAGADIYALTSREDPFPSVVMEALDALTPVVSFLNSGGSAELLAKGGGILVSDMTADAFSNALIDLLDNQDKTNQLAIKGKKIIDEDFSFRSYLFDLLDLLGSGLHRISVIVPNYNYEQYIKERLLSIINQNFPVFEIIVLDDASTDDSIDIIKQTLKSSHIDYKIIINDTNSGSVFNQWKKGTDLAKGTHIWIAEADDSSLDDFLDEVMQGFNTPEVLLSYTESKQVDEKGNILAEDYLEYVADIGIQRWRTPFIRNGKDEIIEALSIKNTIPNVSGVVFSRNALQSVLEKNIEAIKTYKVAGDWLVYVLLLKDGKIAFSPLSLNLHRRHQQGVTIGNFNEHQLNEIKSMQNFVMEKFQVPNDKLSVAAKYIETLKKQFGITQRNLRDKIQTLKK